MDLRKRLLQALVFVTVFSYGCVEKKVESTSSYQEGPSSLSGTWQWNPPSEVYAESAYKEGWDPPEDQPVWDCSEIKEQGNRQSCRVNMSIEQFMDHMPYSSYKKLEPSVFWTEQNGSVLSITIPNPRPEGYRSKDTPHDYITRDIHLIDGKGGTHLYSLGKGEEEFPGCNIEKDVGLEVKVVDENNLDLTMNFFIFQEDTGTPSVFSCSQLLRFVSNFLLNDVNHEWTRRSLYYPLYKQGAINAPHLPEVKFIYYENQSTALRK